MRAVELPTARVAVVAYAPMVIWELVAKFPLVERAVQKNFQGGT